MVKRNECAAEACYGRMELLHLSYMENRVWLFNRASGWAVSQNLDEGSDARFRTPATHDPNAHYHPLHNSNDLRVCQVTLLRLAPFANIYTRGSYLSDQLTFARTEDPWTLRRGKSITRFLSFLVISCLWVAPGLQSHPPLEPTQICCMTTTKWPRGNLGLVSALGELGTAPPCPIQARVC